MMALLFFATATILGLCVLIAWAADANTRRQRRRRMERLKVRRRALDQLEPKRWQS